MKKRRYGKTGKEKALICRNFYSGFKAPKKKMTEKEISELRRRFRTDKSGISRIRGCYVSDKGEIVSEFNQLLGMMTEDESTAMLTILKKTLSGTMGKNLIDIVFKTQQVLDGEEHKLLTKLKNSSLEDDEAVSALFGKIIGATHFDGSYIIILASDKYDVFKPSADGVRSEESETTFSYIICAICPVKLTKPALSYFTKESAFHNLAVDSVIGSPDVGFMFPAYENKGANIYNALFYTRDIAAAHEELIGGVFNTDIPVPAAALKETFQTILTEAIKDECSLELVTAIHDSVCEMLEEKEGDREAEPPMISKSAVKSVLVSCGVEDAHVAAFEEKFDSEFGKDIELHPKTIIDTKQFEVKTPDVTIKVNPERSDIISTQVINGSKYIMIRADEDVEVNGVNIKIL